MPLFLCTRCKKNKPSGWFRKDRSRPTGRSNWCKECTRPVHAAHAARRRSAPGEGYTASDVQAILLKQNYRCPRCGISLWVGYHVDHVVPLARGGRNDRTNIQALCPTCNLVKGAKLV